MQLHKASGIEKYKRKEIAPISKLGASVADDKTTIDKLTKHRKKEWH
jgi:hypothetical protein